MFYISTLRTGIVACMEDFLIYLSEKSLSICVWGFLDEAEIPTELLLDFEEKNK